MWKGSKYVRVFSWIVEGTQGTLARIWKDTKLTKAFARAMQAMRPEVSSTRSNLTESCPEARTEPAVTQVSMRVPKNSLAAFVLRVRWLFQAASSGVDGDTTPASPSHARIVWMGGMEGGIKF